jgi:hypothetical protein
MTQSLTARERTHFLKRLREEHAGTVAQTQALLKEQKAMRQKRCQALRAGLRRSPKSRRRQGCRRTRPCGTSRP